VGLFRDVRNWCRPHGSLPPGTTPAMAIGLATEAWPPRRYATHPVHDDERGRQAWAEPLKTPRTPAVPAAGRRKALPTS